MDAVNIDTVISFAKTSAMVPFRALGLVEEDESSTTRKTVEKNKKNFLDSGGWKFYMALVRGGSMSDDELEALRVETRQSISEMLKNVDGVSADEVREHAAYPPPRMGLQV